MRIPWTILALATLLTSPGPLPAAAREATLSSAEQAVRALERAWLDAYEQLDTAAMKRIVADDFLITFPDGSTQTKGEILTALDASRARPSGTRFHTEEVSSRAFGNTVVLTGIVVTTRKGGGTTPGDRSRYTDTYLQRDGRWQVVASHLSNAPERVARDVSPPDTVRLVRNHTLISRDRPRMRMEVDPRLRYVGVLAFQLAQSAQVHRHVFASHDEQGRPRRMLIVQFESILPGAKGTYTFQAEHPTRLGAHPYQTQTGFFNFDEAAAARPGAEADRTKAYLAEKNLNVESEDYLVARYARVVDPERRSELIVFYYENVRDLDVTRKDLESGGRRAGETAGLLRDVAARARVGFTIHDPRD